MEKQINRMGGKYFNGELCPKKSVLGLLVTTAFLILLFTQCKKNDSSTTGTIQAPLRKLVFNDSNYSSSGDFSTKVLNIYAHGYNANKIGSTGNFNAIFVTADSNYLVNTGEYITVGEIGINNMKLGECMVRMSDSLNNYLLKSNQKVAVSKIGGKTIIIVDNKIASKTSTGISEDIFVISNLSF